MPISFDRHLEVMERYCKEVLAVEKAPLKDKFSVYHALLDSYRNQDKLAESAELTLDILKVSGCVAGYCGERWTISEPQMDDI